MKGKNTWIFAALAVLVVLVMLLVPSPGFMPGA